MSAPTPPPDPWADALQRFAPSSDEPTVETTAAMDVRPDPWREAMRRWVPDPDASTVQAEPAVRTIRLTRRRLVAAIAAGVVALAAIVTGWTFTILNYDRADEWRDRGEALQELVGERTGALNRQTARLNVAATNLRRARAALERSERDVAALEARQTALADEKAQVEDERAFLQGLATSLDTCNTGLRDVLTAIDNGEDPSLVLDLDDISNSCARADEAVQSYLGDAGD